MTAAVAVAAIQPQITALLDVLRSIDDDVAVGNHEAPVGQVPYMVLYVYLNTEDGTVGQPWERMELSFQVTCSSLDPGESASIGDKATAVLLAAAFTIPQLAVVQVRPNGGQGVSRDPDQPAGQAPLFTCTPRFILTTNTL